MQYENVEQSALENNYFRKVLFTNKYSQVVLMSIPPGEDIGREVHEDGDQVLVFVKGAGRAAWETKRMILAPAICLLSLLERNMISLITATRF